MRLSGTHRERAERKDGRRDVLTESESAGQPSVELLTVTEDLAQLKQSQR